jgi:HlyD family secretion protein
MDQIVTRTRPHQPLPIENALGLDTKGKVTRGGRRRWPYAVALVAAAAIAYGGWSLFGGASEEVAYATVPVEKGRLTVEVSATGTLQPLTQVDISSELSGVVAAVLVDANDEVKKGEVLAELDTARIGAQVERAEASLKSADAQVNMARTTLAETEQTFARTEQLSKRGVSGEQALETARAARDRAAASVAIAEANRAIAAAELKSQQADLAKSKIYAPIDGIVLTRSVNPGQTVASSMQAPVLFVIAADLTRMELKAAIDEADIGGVKAGQKARFTVDAFPDRRFDASIRDIAFASVATEGVVTYDARLDVDNAELLLRPGMTTTVSIVVREANDILTVPSAAFRFRPQTEERGFSLRDIFMPRMRAGFGRRDSRFAQDGSRTLFVMRNGQPEAVQVRTGSTDGENTEIVSGLQEGDLVITGIARQRQQG